jgi:hypothetical protein
MVPIAASLRDSHDERGPERDHDCPEHQADVDEQQDRRQRHAVAPSALCREISRFVIIPPPRRSSTLAASTTC